MTKLLFGKQEEIVCIVDVAVRAKDKGDLCLAYKTTTHFLGAGLYVTNDGYVLRVKESSSEYYPLDADAIRAHQTAFLRDVPRLLAPRPSTRDGHYGAPDVAK